MVHRHRIATYAAKLFLEGRGNFILFSGGMGSGPHSGANLHGKVHAKSFSPYLF